MATKKKENNENTKVSGKKADASAVNNAETEAAREKFQEKLKELLSLAKKKKNMLEYQEISDFFADMQLDSDKFEKILDFLEANNIDVLRITDDDADDDILLEVDDDDEIEVEKIDLSVPYIVHGHSQRKAGRRLSSTTTLRPYLQTLILQTSFISNR